MDGEARTEVETDEWGTGDAHSFGKGYLFKGVFTCKGEVEEILEHGITV
jgi:hypothetical protein